MEVEIPERIEQPQDQNKNLFNFSEQEVANFVQAKLQADEIRGTFENKSASIKTILIQIEDNLNVPEDFKVSKLLKQLIDLIQVSENMQASLFP